MREPDSLPDPGRAAGTPDAAMPFDHVVVLMMENHSFDNVLGALSRHGQPAADGLTFDAGGRPTNENPGLHGPVRAFAFPSTAQGSHVSQSWNATHEQIAGGRMDGFVRSAGGDPQPMGFYGPGQLPFTYALARTFTVANRWFSSAPCQTVPNRRFLLAGTAYGAISSDVPTILRGSPPNGTIVDRLDAHGISWHDYFTDLPSTGVIPRILERHPTRLRPIGSFYSDCAAGRLPAVSFVDPGAGTLSRLGSLLEHVPLLGSIGAKLGTPGNSEEDPQDMSRGEAFVRRVVEAVLRSSAWPRTLLVLAYDEHGGYYDHVPPPAAVAPDDIAPHLGANDVPGGYDIYGVRVPAIVVSPHARPGAVSDVVHDHTSVLATIEAKWNLPALTRRDANAATVMDCLDPSTLAFPEPPDLGV